MSNGSSQPETDSMARVLIVEDEVDVAELYEMWLVDRYSVSVAHNGTDALELLDETTDVVLLDRRMPGLSGDEFLDIIRSEGLDCRVAIVSAVTPDFDVIEMGFDDYLTKPVDREEVVEAIEQMLRRSEYDDSLQEFYQLAATRAALQESKSRSELRNNTEYCELEAELDEKQREMDDIVTSFDDDDFDAAFSQFGESD